MSISIPGIKEIMGENGLEQETKQNRKITTNL